MYKVLLVEDEEMIMKSMQFLVNWTELSCVICGCAHNGREGIQQIHALHPDIVVTDIRMPYADGLKMLEETKSQCDYETVIMSGYEEFDYAQKAIRLGVSDYLLKPMDIQEMSQTISRITQRIEKKRKLRKIEESAVQWESKPLVSTNLPTGSARYVTKMVEYIQQNYAEKVSIRDIGEQFGISVPYLHAKFKEATGYGNRIGYYFKLGESEIISIMPDHLFSLGDDAKWFINYAKLHFFDTETTESIGDPEEY